MAAAGADIMVCHMGLTTGGAIGAETALKLDRLRGADQRLGGSGARRASPTSSCCATAGRSPRPTTPPTSWSIAPACHGFYGASSMERLPTEVALTETTRRFTQISVDNGRRTMTGAQFGTFILGLIVVAIVVAIVVWLLHWLYLRSSKERAFVRTGLGGQKVVLDGGAFVLPIVHEVIPVNMNTLRLEVRRGRDKALITKDRMRVDVIAEFYVRVAAEPSAVAAAAQTLGLRTMEPEQLKELVEGKFVDALRTAAAEMTMEELHEKRGSYVKRVRETVAGDLTKNGLELESASLTQLDQTGMEYFNPSNAFDAEGLTRLTEQIEHRKKQRNDVEQDTLIAIRNKNLEAEKLSLDIDRESEYARLTQQREVEIARARQRAEVTHRARAARAGRRSARRSPPSRPSTRRASAPSRASSRSASARNAPSRAPRSSAARRSSWPSSSARSPSRARASTQSEAQAEAEMARALAVSAERRLHRARGGDGRAQEGHRADRRRQAAERDALRLTVVRAGREGRQRATAARRSARRPRPMPTPTRSSRAWRCACAPRSRPRRMRLTERGAQHAHSEARMSALRMKLVEKAEGIIRESVRPSSASKASRSCMFTAWAVGRLGGVDGANGGTSRRRGEFGAALPRAGAAGRPAAARDWH